MKQTKTKHRNTDQKKEIEKKSEGPILYSVSQKNKWNVYNPIALLDQEGHFRGTAIFESKKRSNRIPRKIQSDNEK